jgi:hypothetical protein
VSRAAFTLGRIFDRFKPSIALHVPPDSSALPSTPGAASVHSPKLFLSNVRQNKTEHTNTRHGRRLWNVPLTNCDTPVFLYPPFAFRHPPSQTCITDRCRTQELVHLHLPSPVNTVLGHHLLSPPRHYLHSRIVPFIWRL